MLRCERGRAFYSPVKQQVRSLTEVRLGRGCVFMSIHCVVPGLIAQKPLCHLGPQNHSQLSMLVQMSVIFLQQVVSEPFQLRQSHAALPRLGTSCGLLNLLCEVFPSVLHSSVSEHLVSLLFVSQRSVVCFLVQIRDSKDLSNKLLTKL